MALLYQQKRRVSNFMVSGVFFSRIGKISIQSNHIVYLTDLSQVLVGKAFPGGSDGKESACNAGDPSSIPEPERYAGEEIGYPLQYSWASLVPQLVKNPPVVWETWI